MFFLRKRTSVVDGVFIAILGLLFIGIFVLNSLVPELFPQYYLFVALALLLFSFLRKLDFEVFATFSKVFYIIGIILLISTLIIGSVTRGTVRWIPIGSFAFQPSEIVRPFLFLYFASELTKLKSSFSSYLKLACIALLPLFLIFVQPSFGVTVITLAGFIGMIIARGIDKKVFLGGILLLIITAGLLLLFLKPYQKSRLISFVNPQLDPTGAGYNSIQSVIAVGSGNIFGRGLGEGVQTQLAFLPEKQTDFIFAAIAEELGFMGSFVVVFLTFYIIWNLMRNAEKEKTAIKQYYIIAAFFVYLSQVFVHLGMNLGILPITGVPLPFLSAGGSSLLGTMLMLAVAFSV